VRHEDVDIRSVVRRIDRRTIEVDERLWSRGRADAREDLLDRRRLRRRKLLCGCVPGKRQELAARFDYLDRTR
jgi:hypothetical protein